jgi:hypothetical protein
MENYLAMPNEIFISPYCGGVTGTEIICNGRYLKFIPRNYVEEVKFIIDILNEEQFLDEKIIYFDESMRAASHGIIPTHFECFAAKGEPMRIICKKKY